MSTLEKLILARKVARYLIENKGTIRSTANALGLSSSMIHRLLNFLKLNDLELYNKAYAIMEENRKERAVRGGESTKRKYSFPKKVQ